MSAWLSVVGIGENGLDGLSSTAREAIAGAELLVGGAELAGHATPGSALAAVTRQGDLMEEGVEIFVVTDATSSRTLDSEKACLDRLGAAGAGIVTTEMVVYEWLGRAGTAEFKEILPLIK